jgi:hypothetical protein
VSDADRQTGRTSKQMKDAPDGATFVWCVSASLSYAKQLACYLGRTDLRIVSPYYIKGPHRGRRGNTETLIIDHAYWEHN